MTYSESMFSCLAIFVLTSLKARICYPFFLGSFSGYQSCLKAFVGGFLLIPSLKAGVIGCLLTLFNSLLVRYFDVETFICWLGRYQLFFY